MKKVISILLLPCLLVACKPGVVNQSNAPFYTTEVTSGVPIIYVSPSGKDDAAGDPNSPLQSISLALRKLDDKGGGIIRLAPGIYRETLNISAKATKDAPLIIEGARNQRGEWLSIIDSSKSLDPSLWKRRPDLGPNVYSYPDASPRLLLVNNRSVARIDQRALARRLDKNDLRPGTVAEVFGWPENHKSVYRNREIPFWETIGGIYTPSPDNSELWVRISGGVDPSREAVSSGQEGGVINLQGAEHVILRNLSVRGGQHGINVIAKSEYNRIENCFIPHGRRRINLDGGAANTVVTGNRLEMGFIGQPTGAWGVSDQVDETPVTQEAARKGFVYNYFKYWASPNQVSDDVSIFVGAGEGQTLIQDNLLDGGLIGIGLVGDARVTGNVIRRMSSVGTAIRLGVRNALYDGNLFSDCNLNIRLHQLNEGPARRIELLRNVSILPEGRGTHIFCHYSPPTEFTAEHEIAVYQNTFLGGRTALVLAPAETPAQALRDFRLINNRFIGCEMLIRAKRPILGNRAMFGHFDYNQIAAVTNLTPHDPAVWLGRHNLIEDKADGWSWDDLQFKDAATESATEDILNLAVPFQLEGKEYSPTPEFQRNGYTPQLGAPTADFSKVLSYAQPAH